MGKSPKTKPKKKKAATRSRAKPPETAPDTPVQATAAPAAAPTGASIGESPGASTMSGAAHPAKPSGGGKSMFALVVFVAVLAVGGYATWPYWGHLVSGQRPVVAQKPVAAPDKDDTTLQQLKSERRQMRQELDRLLARMESIESAVETVKKVIHATARPDLTAGQKAEDADSLLALTQRLEDLEKGGQDVKSLIQRLGQLERGATTATATGDPIRNTAQALVLAVSNLRQAISLGSPFADALEALKAVAGGDPAIEAGIVLLAKIAPQGAPTLAVLKDRLSALAGHIVQASRVSQQGGWIDRTVGRLASLVTWRRVDGKGENTSIDAIVAGAENRLKAGDLKGAVKALEGLGVNSRAAKEAAPWMADAKNRIVAERAVATLHVHAVSLLIPAKK